MDAGAIGYGIVQVTILVVGIFLIFLFKGILISFFKLFEEYYSPFNYKRKESFLKSKFDHLIINKSLSQTELKSINFNSFNDFEYPYFLLKNQKNKTIESLFVNIPVVNFFARWIQRRILNILSLEPERKDNKKDKNHVWEVVLSISYIKSDKKKDVKELILLEISDEDLNKEMGLDSFGKEPDTDLIVKEKVRFEGESKQKSVLEKPSLKHKEEAKQKDKLKNFMKETEDTSLIEDLYSISKKIKFKIPIKKKNTKSLKHKEKVKEDLPTNISALSDDLTKLGELKEKGLLTEEEFNEQKKRLLKQ